MNSLAHVNADHMRKVPISAAGNVVYSGPRRFDQRSSHRRWNVDRDEAIGGEQVVLSALLDDSEVAVSFSIAVGDDAIDLVLLQ
jgi:hypothetical protein